MKNKNFQKDEYECANKISKKYKFVIAFENTMCEDYLTEKPHEALKMVKTLY